MSQAPLSDRAKNRLRLAAEILRGAEKDLARAKGRGVKPAPLPFGRETFYEDILNYIAALTDADRASLQKKVDWLEAYDNEAKRLEAAGWFPTTNAKRK